MLARTALSIHSDTFAIPRSTCALSAGTYCAQALVSGRTATTI